MRTTKYSVGNLLAVIILGTGAVIGKVFMIVSVITLLLLKYALLIAGVWFVCSTVKDYLTVDTEEYTTISKTELQELETAALFIANTKAYLNGDTERYRAKDMKDIVFRIITARHEGILKDKDPNRIERVLTQVVASTSDAELTLMIAPHIKDYLDDYLYPKGM